MLALHIIKNLLRYTSPELSDIVLELRNLVASIAPEAIEEIRHGGIVYYNGESGGPVCSGICGIAIKPDHVRLYFTHGAFIPDSHGLLMGSGKAMRFIRLERFEAVPWEYIRRLMEVHANFDPRSLKIL
jgi:hypothetical protein